MANITLIGGSGKVARLLTPLLVLRGDAVRSLIRDEAHASDLRGLGAEPVLADIERLDTDQLAEAFGGSDAVVFAAGAGGGDPDRTYAVDRDAAIRSIDAARQAGIKRFVMISYHGARKDHGVPEDSSFFPYAEAKAAADAHLRESDLDWTIVGPGKLTNEPGADTISVGDDMREDRNTARDTVARVIAHCLNDTGTVGEQIEFTDGLTPLAEAVTSAGGAS